MLSLLPVSPLNRWWVTVGAETSGSRGFHLWRGKERRTRRRTRNVSNWKPPPEKQTRAPRRRRRRRRRRRGTLDSKRQRGRGRTRRKRRRERNRSPPGGLRTVSCSHGVSLVQNQNLSHRIAPRTWPRTPERKPQERRRWRLLCLPGPSPSNVLNVPPRLPRRASPPREETGGAVRWGRGRADRTTTTPSAPATIWTARTCSSRRRRSGRLPWNHPAARPVATLCRSQRGRCSRLLGDRTRVCTSLVPISVPKRHRCYYTHCSKRKRRKRRKGCTWQSKHPRRNLFRRSWTRTSPGRRKRSDRDTWRRSGEWILFWVILSMWSPRQRHPHVLSTPPSLPCFPRNQTPPHRRRTSSPQNFPPSSTSAWKAPGPFVLRTWSLWTWVCPWGRGTCPGGVCQGWTWNTMRRKRPLHRTRWRVTVRRTPAWLRPAPPTWRRRRQVGSVVLSAPRGKSKRLQAPSRSLIPSPQTRQPPVRTTKPPAAPGRTWPRWEDTSKERFLFSIRQFVIFGFGVSLRNECLCLSPGPSRPDETQRVLLLQDEGRRTSPQTRVPADEARSGQRDEKQEGSLRSLRSQGSRGRTERKQGNEMKLSESVSFIGLWETS